MDRNQQQYTPYPEDGVGYPPRNQPYGAQPQELYGTGTAPLSQPPVAHIAHNAPQQYTIPPPHRGPYSEQDEIRIADRFEETNPNDPVVQESKWLNKKWQKRLYWMVPLGIVIIVLCVLFEVYKSDFERWVTPLTDWLRERKAWSWSLPVAILIILSFPPLFGHEIVQLVVGLTYPLGVAIGIAIAGAILGEGACFIVFKYCFTGWVEKKIQTKVRWAAISRVTQEAGFRGVLLIRYSIVPPHLANPLFACTGMKFWLYMTTVIISLPKSIIFVALGAPSSENSKGVKVAKVIAIGIVVLISVYASFWIRKKLKIATKDIEAERAISQGNGELGVSSPYELEMHANGNGLRNASHRGEPITAPAPYHGVDSSKIENHQY